MLSSAAGLALALVAALCAAAVSEHEPARATIADESPADKLWRVIEGLYISVAWGDPDKDRAAFIANRESNARNLREEGIRFLEVSDRKDPRRWRWLLYTTGRPPHYYLSAEDGAKEQSGGFVYTAERDQSALAAWNLLYEQLRREFLHSDNASEAERSWLRANERRTDLPRKIAEADAAWGAVQAILDGASAWPSVSEDPIGYLKAKEVTLREFRKSGLQFCDRFATDERRWVWWFLANNRPPYYFVSADEQLRQMHSYGKYLAPRDEVAIQEWERLTDAVRSEFLETPQVSEGYKASERIWEIKWKLEESLLLAEHGDPIDLNRMQEMVLEFGERFPSAGPDAIALVDFFFRSGALNMSGQQALKFLAALKVSPSKILREVANAKEALVRVKQGSGRFSMRFTALDGREVDVERLRGKVVLIEFWATSCSACVAQMPIIKQLYEKYGSVGFEVIGISFDPPENRDKVAALLRKMRITWPQSLETRKDGSNKYQDQFMFSGIPQTFILDRDGALVSTGAHAGELDALVRKYLEAPVGRDLASDRNYP